MNSPASSVMVLRRSPEIFFVARSGDASGLMLRKPVSAASDARRNNGNRGSFSCSMRARVSNRIHPALRGGLPSWFEGRRRPPDTAAASNKLPTICPASSGNVHNYTQKVCDVP